MCVCLCVCVYMCVCMCLVCVWMCVRVQSLYVVLPGLLDCNPFPADNSEPCWKGGKGFPEPVRRVLQVRARTYRSLQQMSTYLSTRTHTHAGAQKTEVNKKTWKTIQHHQAKQNMCLCVYVCVCLCAGVPDFPGAVAGVPSPPGDPSSDVCLSFLLLQRVTV